MSVCEVKDFVEHYLWLQGHDYQIYLTKHQVGDSRNCLPGVEHHLWLQGHDSQIYLTKHQLGVILEIVYLGLHIIYK